MNHKSPLGKTAFKIRRVGNLSTEQCALRRTEFRDRPEISGFGCARLSNPLPEDRSTARGWEFSECLEQHRGEARQTQGLMGSDAVHEEEAANRSERNLSTVLRIFHGLASASLSPVGHTP